MSKPPDQGPKPDETQTTELINADLFKSLYNINSRLVLRYGDVEKEISPESRVFVVGRSQDCDMQIDAPFASRVHARLVYRQGKFVLIDQSTNGTFVRPSAGSEVCLLEQEEYPLWESGVISLGRSTEEGGDALIHYRFKSA